MHLLYQITVSISSIRATERLFNDQKLYDFILTLNKNSEKSSFLGGLFKSKDAKKDAIEASIHLLTLWTDVTMVYQGEFAEMWGCWKQIKLINSGPVKL